MADRYLLESGSPDGYQLEDGSGVLLLESGIAWDRDTSDLAFTPTSDGLTVSGIGSLARANLSHTTGDYSFTVTSSGTGNHQFGLANASESTASYCGQTANSVGLNLGTGEVLSGGTNVTTGLGASWVDGDVITVRLKNGKVYFAKGGTYFGTMNPTTETGGVDVSTMGALFPAIAGNAVNSRSFTADFTNWVTTGDVTLALTGQALAASRGSLLASTALALTGGALTAAQGSVAPQTAPALSGQSLAAASGSVSPVTSIALTGLSLSAAQGSLGPTTSTSLSGQAASIAQGSVAVSFTLSVAGQALNISPGSLSPATSPGLAGQALSIARGSLGPSLSLSLTGQALSAARGTLTAVIASGGNARVYLGSYVAKPAKVWNGSAWVSKPIKYWNGAAWVVSGA